MNAPARITEARTDTYLSQDGRTSLQVRHASHPDDVRRFTSDELRSHFLVESLFRPGAVALTYTHVDRFVVGGAMPTTETLTLQSLKPIGTPGFMDRRELGVINLGGPGRVVVDGAAHGLDARDSLYVARGAGDVRFESVDVRAPAKFYLLSTPAHATHRTRRIPLAEAKHIALGARETANRRTIHQVIHPDICGSCQLVMGFTELEEGSVWNTMPTHVHERRCEIYCYFDMSPETRVFHFMGEPSQTRHLLVANEQAVLSPSWSIHSGAGTRRYAFVWAMAGDNQDFDDMDMLELGDLR